MYEETQQDFDSAKLTSPVYLHISSQQSFKVPFIHLKVLQKVLECHRRIFWFHIKPLTSEEPSCVTKEKSKERDGSLKNLRHNDSSMASL